MPNLIQGLLKDFKTRREKSHDPDVSHGSKVKHEKIKASKFYGKESKK